MNSTLFLDTTIFFQCIQKDPYKTILDHAVHLGFEIHTSITVLGEALAQMRESDNRNSYIASFNELLDSWNVYTHYPNDPVRIICYVLGDDETDCQHRCKNPQNHRNKIPQLCISEEIKIPSGH
jgi:hypothetical protein